MSGWRRGKRDKIVRKIDWCGRGHFTDGHGGVIGRTCVRKRKRWLGEGRMDCYLKSVCLFYKSWKYEVMEWRKDVDKGLDCILHNDRYEVVASVVGGEVGRGKSGEWIYKTGF